MSIIKNANKVLTYEMNLDQLRELFAADLGIDPASITLEPVLKTVSHDLREMSTGTVLTSIKIKVKNSVQENRGPGWETR